MKFVAVGCLCAGALAVVGCADGRGVPTSPSASAVVSGPAPLAASPRSGDVHATKECSGFTGEAGSFCRITSSTLKAIEVDSRIVYLQPDQVGAAVGSDVVLDLPGPGNNKAFGHCSLAVGVCTFSGGTGKFNGFSASVRVSYLGGLDWAWDGTYSFNLRD